MTNWLPWKQCVQLPSLSLSRLLLTQQFCSATLSLPCCASSILSVQTISATWFWHHRLSVLWNALCQAVSYLIWQGGISPTITQCTVPVEVHNIIISSTRYIVDWKIMILLIITIFTLCALVEYKVLYITSPWYNDHWHCYHKKTKTSKMKAYQSKYTEIL